MGIANTAKPATARHGERASDLEQLGGQLKSSNTLKTPNLQGATVSATLRRTDARPDATGENDWAFFKSRPLLHTRIRVAFPGEFPREILKQGRGRMAVVIVAVERDAAGQPIRRARGVLFPEGGRA